MLLDNQECADGIDDGDLLCGAQISLSETTLEEVEDMLVTQKREHDATISRLRDEAEQRIKDLQAQWEKNTVSKVQRAESQVREEMNKRLAEKEEELQQTERYGREKASELSSQLDSLQKMLSSQQKELLSMSEDFFEKDVSASFLCNSDIVGSFVLDRLCPFSCFVLYALMHGYS